MRIKEIIAEAKKKTASDGDCFEVAGKNMIHPQDPNIMLVHAFVSGQGPLSGKRFEHAWNEIGDEVIDNSNGRNIHMPKMLYYAIGNINPKDPNEYRSYNNKQALKYLVTTKHWGPWELGATSNSLYESADIKTMQDTLAKLVDQAQENHKLYNQGKLALVNGVIPGPWKEIRELQSQIRAARRVNPIKENSGVRLKDLARVATNMKDADFWLIATHNYDKVGEPTKEFKQHSIGIKVTKTDVIDPEYLYYVMLNLYNQGYWKNRGNGVTNRQTIRVKDVKDIKFGQ